MIIGREQDVTVAASAVMERTSDPRLREIMLSLVKHLHGFVRDVRLTEAEFREACAMLVELGQQSGGGEAAEGGGGGQGEQGGKRAHGSGRGQVVGWGKIRS